MIHPDTYVKQTPTGLGIFAGRKFFRGEILWITDDFDLKVPIQQFFKLPEEVQQKFNTYGYLDFYERVVVAWDEGKYVNHSCSPNSTSLLQFDNISVAMREIEKGEQITEDYYCYYGHFESFGCRCGAKNCRSEIKMENTFDASLRLHLADVAEDILSHNQFLLSIESKDTLFFNKLLKETVNPELVLVDNKPPIKLKQRR